MCFGDKDKSDDPGPRPVQLERPSSQQKQSYPYNNSSSANGNGSSSYNPPPPKQQEYAPPMGPPPGQSQYAPPAGPPGQQQQYAPPMGPPPGQQQYAPPTGPPPTQQQEYAPPSGPPPGQYAPPLGPPPAHSGGGDYAPPAGPPPGQSQPDWAAPPSGPPPEASKPKEAWEIAVPDTSLFPPPPAFFAGWERSPANNATEAEAEAGEQWVTRYPLTPPITLDAAAQEALAHHNFRLMQPQGFRGSLDWKSPGVWRAKTDRTAPDSCIISYPPLYAVTAHSPLANQGAKKTIYYEVHILSDSRGDETSLAMGYTALPYPNFRLPGWHRGSLAVHGDDGHKYINDRWGGISFTDPFKRGEAYGIGMTFAPDGTGRIGVEVFFTRQGKVAGSWNLHEETDAAENLPVTGLEGYHDLSCAVGTFNAVSFEVIFNPAKWKYKELNNPWA